jgi:hypothetical protein
MIVGNTIPAFNPIRVLRSVFLSSLFSIKSKAIELRMVKRTIPINKY